MELTAKPPQDDPLEAAWVDGPAGLLRSTVSRLLSHVEPGQGVCPKAGLPGGGVLCGTESIARTRGCALARQADLHCGAQKHPEWGVQSRVHVQNGRTPDPDGHNTASPPAGRSIPWSAPTSLSSGRCWNPWNRASCCGHRHKGRRMQHPCPTARIAPPVDCVPDAGAQVFSGQVEEGFSSANLLGGLCVGVKFETYFDNTKSLSVFEWLHRKTHHPQTFRFIDIEISFSIR